MYQVQEIEFLRNELAELQSALKRSEKGVDLTFLKNVLVRYLKDGEHLETLLPVLAQALELSSVEVGEIRARHGGVLGALRGLW